MAFKLTNFFRKNFFMLLCISFSILGTVLSIYLTFYHKPKNFPGFQCKDPKYSKPYKKDMISKTVLVFSHIIYPLTVLALFCSKDDKFKIKFKKVCFDFAKYFCGVVITVLISLFIKVWFLELRPNFFDVCKPDANENCKLNEYIEMFKCTSEFSEKQLIDSVESFPSTHTAIAFFSFTFFAVFLSLKVDVSKHIKFSLLVLIAIWSLFISISRIYDNKHHWCDVWFGAVLGIFVGIFSRFVLNEDPKKDKYEIKESTFTITDRV